MSSSTGIEWTDATWNPIVGCSIVSKGCTNCYAMRTAGARTKHTAKYTGLTEPSKGGPVWTGEVRFWEKALREPLSWREPRRVFVNSMGDLFHESVPDEWIDRCFAVMALAPQHTFQVLTKRPERMRAWFAERWQGAAAFSVDGVVIPPGGETGRLGQVEAACEPLLQQLGLADPDVDHLWTGDGKCKAMQWAWPLPNVWLGVSCEDQEQWDSRIELLGATPAAVRFVSAEPLLEEIDVGNAFEPAPEGSAYQPIDWLIIGGESGPRARRFDLGWARSLVAQTRPTAAAIFIKQLGAKPCTDRRTRPEGEDAFLFLRDKKGGDWSEWPADLRIREFPKAAA